MKFHRFAIALTLCWTTTPLAAAPGGYEVNPNYEMKLVASEPIVFDPVEAAWDREGRLFVMEMGGYPIAKKTDGKYPGKIAVLEDTDGDGVYDKRTVFADDLRYASSLLPYRDGIYVASPPDLVFMRDTTGDNVADEQSVIFSGFSVGNSQHNFCGLKFGLDGWIYGANGGNSGKVYRLENRMSQTSISGRDFRFHPETLQFETTGRSAGGFGLAFDPYGRYLSTHNLYPVLHMVYPTRDDDTLIQIDADRRNGLSPLYPIGEPETRVNHPEQSGYFSGACGITYYDGGAFPESEANSIFVADVVTNLAFRSILTPDGPIFSAERLPEEKRKEFAATTDRDSRPVNFATGPDGALYMLDFYRDEIEHPEWIPDEIEKDMNVRAGEDKGRIYRFVPREADLKINAELEYKMSLDRVDQIIVQLEHPNRWWRDRAQQWLVEHNFTSRTKKLEQIAGESASPFGRLHAMWTLERLGKLSEETLIARFSDPEPGVRENALQIATDRVYNKADIRHALLAYPTEPDRRVRMQLLLTLGLYSENANPETRDIVYNRMVKIVVQDLDHEWSRNAFLTAGASDPLELYERLSPRLAKSLEGPEPENALHLLSELAQYVGQLLDPDSTRDLLAKLASSDAGDSVRATILDRLYEGLESRIENPESLARFLHKKNEDEAEALRTLLDSDSMIVVRSAWRLANLVQIAPGPKQLELLEQARATAGDPSADETQRLAALGLLELAPFDSREEMLFELLDPRNSGVIQVAALNQLSHGPNGRIAPRLVDIWKRLGPGARKKAGDMLLYRSDNHDLLLESFENGDILIGQMRMDLERRRVLLRARDPRFRRRAADLFSDAGVVTRAAAIKKMEPALELAGDADKGKTLFADMCSRCHIMAGEGHEVGPNLTEVFRKSKATLLHDILDPNAAVDTEYISYTIETKDGEIKSGLLHAESPSHVTLREGGGETTDIPRDRIDRMWSSGLSLMPEELEVDMTPEAMADLIAFLQLPR